MVAGESSPERPLCGGDARTMTSIKRELARAGTECAGPGKSHAKARNVLERARPVRNSQEAREAGRE